MSTSDEKGVDKFGYKEYIGGDYENIGNALSDSLIHKLNLRTNDVFLDIGCGSLRVGIFLIRYLEKNNFKYFKYMGNEWGHPRKQHLFLFTKTEKIYEKYANLLTD